jgi:hypothetical protein
MSGEVTSMSSADQLIQHFIAGDPAAGMQELQELLALRRRCVPFISNVRHQEQ